MCGQTLLFIVIANCAIARKCQKHGQILREDVVGFITKRSFIGFGRMQFVAGGIGPSDKVMNANRQADL